MRTQNQLKWEVYVMHGELCPFSQKPCRKWKCKFWGKNDCLFVEQLIISPKAVQNLNLEPFEGTEVLKRVFRHLDLKKEDVGNREKNGQIVDNTDEIDEGGNVDNEQPAENMEKEEEYMDEENKRIEELLKRMDPQPIPAPKTRFHFFDELDEVPKYLEKSKIEIAQELADYCAQIKPNLSNWHDFNNIRDMFWETHNSKTYHLPAKYRMKVDEIENLAREILINRNIPDFLRTSSVDELAAEMMRHPLESSKYEFDKIWNDERMKNIKVHDLPQDLQVKIEAANERAKELLKEERENEMKKRALKLVNPLIDWCKARNLPEITALCVFAFLYEQNIDLSADARAYLEFLTKEKYSDK